MTKRRRTKSIVPRVPATKKGRHNSIDEQNSLDSEESLTNWESRIRKEGSNRANEMRTNGRTLDVRILAPRVVKSGDTIPLAGVIIKPDWKIAAKQELVDVATDFISKAYLIGSLDPALPVVLKSIIEEKGLYAFGVGEFFLLYGRFQEKFGVFSGNETREKMSSLVNNNKDYLKRFKERGRWHLYPLPFAVRNILAHPNNRDNALDQEGNDIRTSIILLREWVGSQ